MYLEIKNNHLSINAANAINLLMHVQSHQATSIVTKLYLVTLTHPISLTLLLLLLMIWRLPPTADLSADDTQRKNKNEVQGKSRTLEPSQRVCAGSQMAV